MKTGPILLLALAAAAQAQPLKVYSEFVHLNAQGDADAAEFPREILSPAVARNAFTSFQVSVQTPPGTTWQLYVAQNPENAVQVTLYRETGDSLTKLAQPVAGRDTETFWMDVWAAPDAPVDRIKVEPQLHINGDWVIYPMEARIMDAAVPAGEHFPMGSAGPVEVMRGFLCGTKFENPLPEQGPLTIRAMRFRNAQQDRALAPSVPRMELQKRFGSCEAAPPEGDPEWYYRVRDFLFQGH